LQVHRDFASRVIPGRNGKRQYFIVLRIADANQIGDLPILWRRTIVAGQEKRQPGRDIKGLRASNAG